MPPSRIVNSRKTAKNISPIKSFQQFQKLSQPFRPQKRPNEKYNEGFDFSGGRL